ncbi:unnamed protein product [Gongylonema pulchrum]|uniref:Secreted protein n=1 Tax=Gongylonema pulchrum TaxID=637853 RepID=A0A183DN63_9BILA|nr:unnamed protein product [Gongylonema pulchrum]
MTVPSFLPIMRPVISGACKTTSLCSSEETSLAERSALMVLSTAAVIAFAIQERTPNEAGTSPCCANEAQATVAGFTYVCWRFLLSATPAFAFLSATAA